MSTDEKESNTSKPHLQTEPVDIGNEKYLDLRLSELREKYSYERLSGLSARRLRGKGEEDAMSEEDNIYIDFRLLRSEFPHFDYIGNEDKVFQKIQKGDNYRGLSTLTSEQNQRIRDCKTECIRNLDRAMQEAIDREKSESRVSRLGNWLNEFVNNLTPLFVIQW